MEESSPKGRRKNVTSMGDPATTAIAVLEERIKALKDSVDKVLSKLEDNGKDGFFTRVGKTELRLDTIEQQHTEEKEKSRIEDMRRKKNQDQIMIGILFLVLSNMGVIVVLIRHAITFISP